MTFATIMQLAFGLLVGCVAHSFCWGLVAYFGVLVLEQMISDAADRIVRAMRK